MKIYGYLRVSTDEQDSNSQKQGVDDFAKKNNWTIDEYIRDEGISGGKDPSKRALGPLLDKLQEGDKLIAAEISRLGRDLLMVMEILNHCMKVGCVVYTVKDNYVLGDDVQSKVLAFAFGLAAEIERKMIQARTKEGLLLRVKKGVLLGRPPAKTTTFDLKKGTEKKEQIIMQYNLGVPLRRMEKNLGINRQTLTFRLIDWGIIKDEKLIASYERRKKESAERNKATWKDSDLCVVNFSEEDYAKITKLIEANLIIPDIKHHFPSFTYEQIYDTIFYDSALNLLYREHGQKRLTAEHKKDKDGRF